MADYLDQLVQRGVISDDVAARLTSGEPQRQSRFDILRQGLDTARDYLTPGYFRDMPSSPQADRALADPNARPGKIGPPSGPPTGMQIAGGLAGDVAANALPGGKLSASALAKWLGGSVAFWKANPAKAARVDELIAQGYGRQAIAEHPDVQVGKAAIGRYLDYSGQKTAAAENPGFWEGNPGAVDEINAGLARGDSLTKIAKNIGTSVGNVWQKITQRPSDFPHYAPREPSFWDNPAKQAEFKRDVKDGLSVRQLARKYETGTGNISGWIHGIQERHGELLDWGPQTPQGGKTLTPAGKTPTLPQLKSQARPITREDLEAGPDFAKAMRVFLPSGP